MSRLVLSRLSRRSKAAVATVIASALVGAADVREASAAGLYFSDRGVRPMGRAGAFVAGADDLGAIAYNPAGLADAKTSALADFAFLRFDTSYTRELEVTDADGIVRTVTSPTVRGTSPVIPFPTLAGSYAFGDRGQYTVAGGAWAPYAAIATYPETVEGKPSPARYALGAFDGSALLFTGAFFAYKPVESFRVGIGLGALVGIFQSDVTFSMSPPDRLAAAPEQPEYDAQSRVRVGPIFAPTGSLGATWIPHRLVRVGASAQLPAIVSAPATFDVRLPTAAIFDGASVRGRDAHVRFKLPPILRAGVELRPTDDLRVELAYVRELWSVHDAIELTPEGVALENVTGLPSRIALPPVRFPRNFEDASSFRLGGELTFRLWGYAMTARAGAAYETSAIPRPYLSIITIDTDKLTLSIGGGVKVGEHWRLDAVYAHLFASSVAVPASEAAIGRVNPLPGNAPLEAVNGGRYAASGDLLGFGAMYTF